MLVHLLDGVGDEALPLFGHHQHVDSGVDGARAVVDAAPGHLPDPVPVGHDEAIESHAILQHIRQQRARAVHLAVVLSTLAVVPAVVGGHYRLHARAERADIALSVNADHLAATGKIDAAIHAAVGPAIADEVLGGCHCIGRTCKVALQSGDEGSGILAHQRRVRGVALVAAAPAVILHHRQCRREHPVDAGGADLRPDHRADLTDQCCIVCGAQTDVMRENRCATHDAVAVHGVRAPDQRNLGRHVRRQGGGMVQPRRFTPLLKGGEAGAERLRIRAVQNPAQIIAAHIIRRRRTDIRLGHLADFLCHRHAGNDCLYA